MVEVLFLSTWTLDMEALGGIEVVPALMVLLVFGVIFAFLREFFCWYWKINERIELQKQILAALNGEAKTESTASPSEQ